MYQEAHPPVDPSELSKDQLVTIVHRIQRLLFGVYDSEGNQIGWESGEILYHIPCKGDGSWGSHEGLIEWLLEILMAFDLDARAIDDVPIRGRHKRLKFRRSTRL